MNYWGDNIVIIVTNIVILNILNIVINDWIMFFQWEDRFQVIRV